MRLVIDIDIDRLGDEKASEVGRILRYWAGGLTDELLVDGTSHDLMDSAYEKVGTLAVTD